jgi:5'-3' exonuclease
MQQAVKNMTAKANNLEPPIKNYYLIVDGNSILKSSLVAKDMVNDKGEEYGAVLLFLRRIGNLLLKKDFNKCIVCWDGYNSGVLRWKIYPDYKANRNKKYEIASEMNKPKSEYDAYIENYAKRILEHSKQKRKEEKKEESDDENFQRQRDILISILDELFVRQYMYDDVEGDDLIAYLCNNKKENEYIVIVSEDRDISQLINRRVCLYIPSKKVFVTPDNAIEHLGILPENIVLKKMICGDASDNIKGIKGMGETTLMKYCPQIKDRKTTLEGFLEACRLILDERIEKKKKPLLCLLNALKKATDGCQGKKIYEINRKIIDLSHPLLTEEASKELEEIHDAPIDPEGRGLNNVYNIVSQNKMSRLLEEKTFGDIFGMYERIKKKECEKYYENNH